MTKGAPRAMMKESSDKKKAAHLTMMVIPHCQGAEIKNIRIPMWLLKSLAGTGVVCILIVAYFVAGFFNLRYVATQNAELKEVNIAQAQEIDELKDFAGEMRGKIESLMKLDQEVRAKVGLTVAAQEDKQARASTDSSIDSSRTSERYQFMTMGLGTVASAAPLIVSTGTNALVPYAEQDQSVPFDESAASAGIEGLQEAELVLELPSPADEIDTLDELKEQLAKMDELLTKQAETMNKLNTDVDKQLAYERALPTLMPVQGRLTSGFGWRKNPYSSKSREFHEGIDIAGAYGTPIRAAGYGVVTFSGYKSGWGRVVIISHGYGYVTQYAHNSQLLVKKGDKIERGQIIARLGSTGRSTGPHLHFGVAKNGKWINPLTIVKR